MLTVFKTLKDMFLFTCMTVHIGKCFLFHSFVCPALIWFSFIKVWTSGQHYLKYISWYNINNDKGKDDSLSSKQLAFKDLIICQSSNFSPFLVLSTWSMNGWIYSLHWKLKITWASIGMWTKWTTTQGLREHCSPVTNRRFKSKRCTDSNGPHLINVIYIIPHWNIIHFGWKSQ